MIEGSRPRGDDSVAQDGDATDDGVMQNSVVTPHTDANTGDTTAGVHEVSLVPVVTVLQTDGSSFVDAVFTHLFACRPSFIRRLPADLSQLKPSFRRALVHVYAKQATGNGLDRRTRRFLRHLAEDHRSFGVEAPDYVAMGDAITVVRLAADSPIPYRAGQLVPVLAPQSSGKRKWLAPAIPHSDDGLIEFHLEVPRSETPGRQALTGSSALVFDLARMTRPGDVWEIGAARGSMTVDLLDGTRPALLVAYGAHLAVIRAIILDIASNPSPPQTNLFFGAEYPSDLYELRTLWSFDTAMDWLTVHPSTVYAEEDQFARMSAYAVAPRDFTVREGMSLADDVMARGPWLGHETLLAGPKAIVGDIKQKLMASGMNPALITMTS